MNQENIGKVEKGIPLPPKRCRHAGVSKYPWEKMEVGDSFCVVGTTRNKIGAVITYREKKHPGEEYSFRSLDNGVRVWRVK